MWAGVGSRAGDGRRVAVLVVVASNESLERSRARVLDAPFCLEPVLVFVMVVVLDIGVGACGNW
jgi:hypothetical protein